MRKYKEGNYDHSLDEKSIEKHQNFDHLITNYQQVIDSVHKKPLYQSKKGFLLILIIVLIVTVLVISQDEKQGNEGVKKENVR